jgi:hypothetical protein
MGKLVRPVLFSTQFGIPKIELEKRNLLDPILNADTKVFIDPLLLRSSKDKIVSSDGLHLLRERFQNVMRLLIASNAAGDAAWRAAASQLDLDERQETCLGFGGSGVSGSSRPDVIKARILTTTREVIGLGISDPEIISLMGFLEEDVGPDTISDLTTNAIVPALARLTQEFCREHDIPMKKFWIAGGDVLLPENPFARKPHGVMLVPRDVLLDLPIAADMSDVSRVAFENKIIRDRVNSLIANFAKATVAEKKAALKSAALHSAKNFLDIFESLVKADRAYDPEADPDGIYGFRKALKDVAQQHPRRIAMLRENTATELVRVVNEIIDQFRVLVEDRDLSHLLWNGDQPRKEKAAQLLFYGVAEAYCQANNIEIAPETHSGGGPVDFRFSRGFAARYVVELKLSTGSVVHGYETQLDVYRKAANDCDGALVVVIVGSRKVFDDKMKKVRANEKARHENGERPSAIHVIDATKKPSASRRKPGTSAAKKCQVLIGTKRKTLANFVRGVSKKPVNKGINILSTLFGTRGSQVQILPLRPANKLILHAFPKSASGRIFHRH